MSGAQKYVKYAAAAPQQARADAFQASQAQLLPKTAWSKFDASSAEGGRSRTSTRDNLGARNIFGLPIDEAARQQGRKLSRPTPAVSTEAAEDKVTMPKPVQRKSTPILDDMEIDEETQASKTVSSRLEQPRLLISKANVNSNQTSEQKKMIRST